MARLRLYALTAVGAFFLVYELLTEAMSPQGPSLAGFVWILLFIPMYAVGAWLTWRLPDHPQAVRLLVSGTAFVAGRGVRLAHCQPAAGDQLILVSGVEHAEPRGRSGRRVGYGATHRQLSGRLRRTSVAAADAALVVDQSSRSTADSARIARCAGISLGRRRRHSPELLCGELARLASRACPRASTEQLGGRCRRCARHVCPLCRGRCRRPGEDASPVRCRRRWAGALSRSRSGDCTQRSRGLGPGRHFAHSRGLTAVLL